jgi:hypothetical protein
MSVRCDRLSARTKIPAIATLAAASGAFRRAATATAITATIETTAAAGQ